MSRFTLIFILLLSVPAPGFSQTDSSSNTIRKHAISSGFFVSAVPNFFNYFACYSFQKGRNRWMVGPVFSQGLKISSKYIHSLSSKPLAINGATLVYQFFPNARGKRYDLFFQYEATWQQFRDKGKTMDQGIGIDYTSRATYFANFFGYGLSIKFLRHFQINHNVGLGVLWAQAYYNNKPSFHPNSGLSGNTRISLVYTIP